MEAVKYLMGAYFHQDWVMDGGAVSDTVDQIDELVREDLPEGALEARLDEWGCDYYAGDTDDDYRRWLSEVRDQLRVFLATSAAS